MALTHEPSEYDLLVYFRTMNGLPPIGPLTEEQQQREDAEEEYHAAMERMCGVGISTGGFDPYGTSCDRDAGHDGPHEGPDWFGCGRLRWTGGGSCVGDPLPYTIVEHVEEA